MHQFLKRFVSFADKQVEIFDDVLLGWVTLAAFLGPLALGTWLGAVLAGLIGGAGTAFAVYVVISEWRDAAALRKLRRGGGSWPVPIDTDGFSSYPPETDKTDTVQRKGGQE